MVTALVHRSGVRGGHLYAMSPGRVGMCTGLWIRAKTVGQDERGNTGRRPLFVGRWPLPWLMGETLDRRE